MAGIEFRTNPLETAKTGRVRPIGHSEMRLKIGRNVRELFEASFLLFSS